MSQAKVVDISHISFTSTVFPTDEDMRLWRSLSPAERAAVIARDEEAGFRSGAAEAESLDDRLKRVRAGMAS